MGVYKTLQFATVQCGDRVIDTWPDDAPQTPPEIETGIFRDTAIVIADSVNRLHRRFVRLLLVRSGSVELDLAVAALQAKQNTRGIVSLLDDAAAVRWSTDETWVCERVISEEPPPGFGGRLTDRLVMVFIGSTAPTTA